MRAVILAGFLCTVLTACVGRAEAGSNAGSTAWLSSASDVAVTTQNAQVTDFPVTFPPEADATREASPLFAIRV